MHVRVTKPNRFALLASAVLAAACGGDATGPDGRPAALTKYGDTDNQIAMAGTAVPNAPAVLVVDQAGRPVSGARVVFTVTEGGGTVSAAPGIEGGSTLTVVSDASGLASTGAWTVGPTLGQNRLLVSAEGVSPVSFLAISADACSFAEELALGSSLAEALASRDCDDGFFFHDFYSTPVSITGAVMISLKSPTFDTYLELFDEAGNYIALNDDREGPDAGIKAILKTNNYVIGATSYVEHATGPYTLEVTPASTAVEACEEVWTSTGVDTRQTLSPTDCIDSSNRYYSDRILIILNKGQKLTVTMNSTDVDSYLQLDDVSGATVALDDNGNGGKDARLVYTSPSTKAYYIDASTHLPGQTGTYILGVH